MTLLFCLPLLQFFGKEAVRDKLKMHPGNGSHVCHSHILKQSLLALIIVSFKQTHCVCLSLSLLYVTWRKNTWFWLKRVLTRETSFSYWNVKCFKCKTAFRLSKTRWRWESVDAKPNHASTMWIGVVLLLSTDQCPVSTVGVRTLCPNCRDSIFKFYVAINFFL